MSAADEAIALLRSRVNVPRLGRSAWREADRDILAMRKALETLELNDGVCKAWTEPGVSPDYHYAMKAKLRQEWPALAGALDRLARRDAR